MSKINTKIKKNKKLNTANNLEKQIPGSFRCIKNRTISRPLLYRLVYSTKISFITVFILLLSFVLQGASLTYAQEASVADLLVEENSSAPLISEADDNSDEISSIADGLNSSTLSAENIVSDLATVTEVQELTNLVEVEAEIKLEISSTSDTSPPLDDPPISEATTDEDVNPESLPNNESFEVFTDGSTSSEEIIDSDTIVDINTGFAESAEDEIVNETLTIDLPEDDNPLIDVPVLTLGNETSVSTTSSSESATTTASTTPVLTDEAVTVTNSDTEFTFNRNECTTLASGSFYCLKADTELLEDALFASPDVDGDLEIYLVRNGIQSQVTSNQVDDAAPYFDQNSDTIVWHRLVNDRYQIISYDIFSGVESQLTTGNTNSMEPTRQGKYTVWQNWSNNNWNVVLFDGKEQRTITESTAHDIAPYVHGSLVVWNRYTNGKDKTIEMYDMISETYVTVDDPEGLSVTNPRMVFVYDSLHPNGDVVTKGYDMISRKFIQLDTLPRQLPDEIPESESTGETRALIQSKPSVKSEESIQNNTATSSGPIPPNLTPATTGDSMTLDLTATTSTTATVEIIPMPEIPAMTEYELVIPPLEIPVLTVQE